MIGSAFSSYHQPIGRSINQFNQFNQFNQIRIAIDEAHGWKFHSNQQDVDIYVKKTMVDQNQVAICQGIGKIPTAASYARV